MLCEPLPRTNPLSITMKKRELKAQRTGVSDEIAPQGLRRGARLWRITYQSSPIYRFPDTARETFIRGAAP